MLTPICNFGWKPPAFELPDTDGKIWKLEDIRGANGTLVMFICNHCPYVKSIVSRIVADALVLQDMGVGITAICANDADSYPDDSYGNMKIFASENSFTFPYLHDETQAIARAWDAVCTPDFFGFNAELELQYRGRLDESGKEPAPPGVRRELLDAMRQIGGTGSGPPKQTTSMGCSIKWKAA